MGLETGNFIQDLVESNPPATDPKSQGDDHLRLLKAILKGQFPNAVRAFYFPTTSAKTASFTVTAADMHKTFLIDTTSGNVVVTLPTLVAGDAGWEVTVLKTNTGTNPIFITPASGTIQSGDLTGLSKTRRCIPGKKSRIMWTGTAWIAERAVTMPVGSIIDCDRATLPVGYEWPDGTSLAAASYPDWSAAKGAATTRDVIGRVIAGYDPSGTKNRLTDLSGGVDDGVLGDTGGAESHLLTINQMPSHDHGGQTGLMQTNTTAIETLTSVQRNNDAGLSDAATANFDTPTSIDHRHDITAQGGGLVHNNVQPTIVLPKILVVE